MRQDIEFESTKIMFYWNNVIFSDFFLFHVLCTMYFYIFLLFWSDGKIMVFLLLFQMIYLEILTMRPSSASSNFRCRRQLASIKITFRKQFSIYQNLSAWIKAERIPKEKYQLSRYHAMEQWITDFDMSFLLFLWNTIEKLLRVIKLKPAEILSCVSVCWVFLPKQIKFKVDELQQCYVVWMVLNALHFSHTKSR